MLTEGSAMADGSELGRALEKGVSLITTHGSRTKKEERRRFENTADENSSVSADRGSRLCRAYMGRERWGYLMKPAWDVSDSVED